MFVITKRELIDSIAERWESWCLRHRVLQMEDKAYKYRLLKALPATATEDDIAKIIGNESWTRLVCDECGRKVDALVTIGQAPAIDSATANVCVDCLKAAVALVSSV